MRPRKLLTAFGVTLLVAAAGTQSSCRHSTDGSAASPRQVVEHASRKTMAAFGSESELTGFLRDLSDAQKRERERAAEQAQGYGQQPGLAPPPPAEPPPAQAAPAPSASAVNAAKDSSEESVTNVQHAGVDEGGIVKVHGRHLVVLRRGRLFTIEIGNGELTPISTVDAFGPDMNPNGTWYDEMLIGNDTIVVIGYSYERGGTELGLFDIDRHGKLAYRATYHLRSNDYYSSRNYASRLIGNKLVFYSPLYLSLGDSDLYHSFPALRKWRKGANDGDFRRIVSATRVYRPIFATDSLTLHSVTVCDLAQRELSCEATAVLGPAGRVFYVSPGSVFVWVTDVEKRDGRIAPRSLVYRLPLDGGAPSALRTAGAPVDQFSFLEGADGNLNVLVRAEAQGEGMWGAETAEGEVALLRVPLRSFSDGVDAAPARAYRSLPKPSGYTFQNRFVGDYLLYGTGSGWGAPEDQGKGVIHAYRYASNAEPLALALAHGVDRIEPLGGDAVVIGTDGTDLHFSPVRLGARAAKAAPYTRKHASQGELRSHGFFYKPTDEDSGLLGLPIREPGRPGYEHLFNDSASVLFLENDALRLNELGALAARPGKMPDDNCKASCVDWYGNARPLFLRGRVFALLGYEIVEGTLAGGQIRETRRMSFAPGEKRIAR
jgi:hypothetical protein